MKDILLVTERQYLPVVMALLDDARESVDVLAYSFAVGSAKGKLDFNGAPFAIMQKLKEVKAKRKRKIRVRVYLEGDRDTADRNRVTAEHLAKAGIEVVFGATHAKGFCVDGRYLLLGSTNLTNQSIRINNETNVLVDDKKTAAQFTRYFEHLLQGGEHGEITLAPPLLPDGEFKAQLVRMIDEAKKSLEFSIYFFEQKEVEQAFVRALKRKVRVTGFIGDHRAFAMSYVRRTRATIRRLRQAGAKDLHFAPNNLFTHSKYLIKDRQELLIGTGNWLNEDVEIHPQLYLLLKDKAVARRLALHLKKQIAALPFS